MSDAACKIILDKLVQTGAGATAEVLESFSPDVVESLADLDLAYLGAMHLIQTGDEKTMAAVAGFGSAVASRAATKALARANEFEG